MKRISVMPHRVLSDQGRSQADWSVLGSV
jgi:hypothetical protein